MRKLLRGMFFLGHPFPAFMNAVAGTIFFLIASREILRVDAALMFCSIYLTHYSIGGMNDYCDEALDKSAHRVEKPLVAGELSRAIALYLWLLSGTAGVVSSCYFGPAAVAVAILVWFAGAGYNVWAKPTVFSWLPYAIFIPSLPVWGFAAAERLTPILFLSYPLGALLSLGLNIANTLPDLERDLREGLKGITHRLGRRRALLLLWCSLAATIVLLAPTPAIMGNNASVLVPGLFAGTVLLAGMIADCLLLRSPECLRRSWYLTAICSIVLGCSWVASLR